ncbi:NADH-quinone oxidoreductase chain 3 [bacterium HR11]|nr:NADH-quinone oxidoreductase chain 3 [bacterium HR11]
MDAPKKVTITIDGRVIETTEGLTVIQVTDQVGIPIPRYCYHPGLSIVGNCRICLVKVEKIPKLVPACATPVQDGMVVYTNTDDVVEARRSVLEFLLLNHPVDCPVCDRSGECYLQDYYMQFGLYRKRRFAPRLHKEKAKPIGPYVILDQERCILCTRCIRVCEEVAKKPQLGLFQRGNRTVLDVFPGQQLDHDYSGCTVDVCPVGALLDRDFRFKARVWFLNRTRSICPGCSTGCNIYVDWNEDKPYLAQGQRVFRLKPRYNPDVNRYWMCDYGRYGYKYIDRDRIPRPYRQTDGRRQPIEWSEALELIRTHVETTLREVGPAGIAVLLSPHLSTEELYLGWKLFAEALGVRDIHYEMPTRNPKADDFLIRAEKFPNAAGARLLGIGTDGSARAILENAAQGRYRLLWLVGQNPVRCYGAELFQAVVRQTPLVVLQTVNWTESTSLAHLILPAAPFAEKEGTFVNAQYRIQRFWPAVRPYKQARPDWVIFQDVARALGLPGWNYIRAEDVFQEMARRFPVFQGLDYATIGDRGVALQVERAAAPVGAGA